MQFKIIPEPVYVTADETNRAFFEVAGKLSLKDFNITITLLKKFIIVLLLISNKNQSISDISDLYCFTWTHYVNALSYVAHTILYCVLFWFDK